GSIVAIIWNAVSDWFPSDGVEAMGLQRAEGAVRQEEKNMFHPRGRRNLGRSTSVLLLLLALIVAACGGGDGGNESETPAQTETTGSEAPATTAGGEEDGDTTESTAAEESGELTPVEIVV